MPRKGPAVRRSLTPDPVYRSSVVTQLVNKVLRHGKRSTAEQIVYGALRVVETKTGSEPVGVLKDALESIRPQLEVRSRRVGGATYQVPIEVPRNRRFYLASQWIINAASNRSGKPMSEKLATELIAAANGDGGAIKKKDDTHRMAEANKAFAHFR